MKRTHRNAGFSLIEMATAVGIVAILAALSYAALEVLPQRTRLTGGALEFAAVLSSARSHAYGRNERVAVIINADGPNAGQPIRYWVLVDYWSNLQEAMKGTASWSDAPKDLTPPAPAASGSEYRLIDSGNFNPTVRVMTGGFRAAVGSVAHPGCTALLAQKIGLSVGHPTSAGSDTFPPPFCFVPNNQPCTFCSGDGTTLKPYRGAVFFEPDGTVAFYDGDGNKSSVGAGSITFLPVGGGGNRSAQAVAITNTGLVRTFSASR
jgi:prepilin-type N-terminal cleavage/methylation domain-containing protein